MIRMRIAVIGATGAVGSTILRILEERDFPLDEVVPLASPRSEGKLLPFRGEQVPVRVLGERWFDGIDIALASAGGAVSKEALPPAGEAGTVCIDNSSYFRMRPNVPIVVLCLFLIWSGPLAGRVPAWLAATVIFAIVVFLCDLLPKLLALSAQRIVAPDREHELDARELSQPAGIVFAEDEVGRIVMVDGGV